jgi:hypothetical protein
MTDALVATAMIVSVPLMIIALAVGVWWTLLACALSVADRRDGNRMPPA